MIEFIFVCVAIALLFLIVKKPTHGSRSKSSIRRRPSVDPVRRALKPAKSPGRPIRDETPSIRDITNGVEHAPPPPFPISMLIDGPAHVIDGDTIRVKKIKIRLAGIDAPELDRPWGQKSKWEMVRICKGHHIHVELTGDTSYDRLLGTCFLPDGTDIGAELVKAGLALDGGYYSKGKYRHLEPAGVRRKIRPFGNQETPRS